MKQSDLSTSERQLRRDRWATHRLLRLSVRGVRWTDAWLKHWRGRQATNSKNHLRKMEAAMPLEPDGGNYYRPHMLQVHSGLFWRCRHGHTSFAKRGCWRCALSSPLAWWRWHFPNGVMGKGWSES